MVCFASFGSLPNTGRGVGQLVQQLAEVSIGNVACLLGLAVAVQEHVGDLCRGLEESVVLSIRPVPVPSPLSVASGPSDRANARCRLEPVERLCRVLGSITNKDAVLAVDANERFYIWPVEPHIGDLLHQIVEKCHLLDVVPLVHQALANELHAAGELKHQQATEDGIFEEEMLIVRWNRHLITP